MRILYILKHNPWGIGGGCYACRSYLEALSDVFNDAHIDVLICKEYLINDERRSADLFKNCHFVGVPKRTIWSLYMTPFTGILHRHQNMASRMLRTIHYDYCIFDHNSIAGSLVNLCKRESTKTIVLNHNCEQEYFHDNNNALRNLLILPSVVRNEKRSFLTCDYNIFLTEEDSLLYQKLYGNSKTKVIVGGCFIPKNTEQTGFFQRERNPKDLKLVISGTIGNVQNLDGINYFLDELYDVIPTWMQVIITGKNAPKSLLNKIKGFPNIQIIPDPIDIDAIVRECDIFLCTTRLGSGMKLRLMDGFRNGLPVITHHISARGYGEFLKKGVCWSFSEKESFGSALNEAIAGIVSQKITPELINDAFNEIMSYDVAIKRIRGILFQ